MNRAVAYIDILGFTSYVDKNIQDAITVMSNANDIISILFYEKTVHPSDGYDPSLQELALRNSIESIDDYLPFSDSVFLSSSNPSQFLLQLGSFLSKAFLYTANIYTKPKELSRPTESVVISTSVDEGGHLFAVKTKIHVPPVLFRGGVTYGEVERLSPMAIVNGIATNQCVLVGDTVVRAVSLEKSIKGPRIIFEDDLYSQLNTNTKKYCRRIPGDLSKYELLWPAMGYIANDRYEHEFHIFSDFFDPAYNLWLAFKNDVNVEIQYRKFLELIIVSTLSAYDTIWNKRAFAAEKILLSIRGKSGISMLEDLLV